MKLVIDERMKHRLTGVLVVVSVIAIFLPAIMKSSNHRFDEALRLASTLPSKPEPPKLNIPSEKELFKEVTVAKVDTKQLEPEQHRPSQLVQVAMPKKVVKPTAKAPVKVAKKQQPAPIVKPIIQAKAYYSVQIASFTQKDNAKALVEKLKTEGYKASFNTVMKKQGPLYKVTVGELSQRDDAISLRKDLVDNMQMKGFIIKTGVS